MYICAPCQPIVGLAQAGADHPPLLRQGKLLTQPLPSLPALMEQETVTKSVADSTLVISGGGVLFHEVPWREQTSPNLSTIFSEFPAAGVLDATEKVRWKFTSAVSASITDDEDVLLLARNVFSYHHQCWKWSFWCFDDMSFCLFFF